MTDIAVGLGLAVIGFAVLVAMGVSWRLAGLAMFAGIAGLAVQTRSMLAEPDEAASVHAVDDSELIALREAMFGRFTADGQWLVAADALGRAGAHGSAVRAILGGIRVVPDSALLWTGLGSALATHDGGLSLPARFAFARAARLAPAHPGPWFLRGVAERNAGDGKSARVHWNEALRQSPPGSPYRAAITARMALPVREMAAGQRR